jgi:hypothetical protein
MLAARIIDSTIATSASDSLPMSVCMCTTQMELTR